MMSKEPAKCGNFTLSHTQLEAMIGAAHAAGITEMAVFTAGGKSPEMSFQYAERIMASQDVRDRLKPTGEA